MGDSPLICDRGITRDTRRAIVGERRRGIASDSRQAIDPKPVLAAHTRGAARVIANDFEEAIGDQCVHDSPGLDLREPTFLRDGSHRRVEREAGVVAPVSKG